MANDTPSVRLAIDSASRPARRIRWDVGVVSAIGLRSSMEDRHLVVARDGRLLGVVCDGHSGTGAADRVARAFPEIFWAALAESGDPAPAFVRTYAELDRSTRRLESGCGATAAFLTGTQITVAHVGDARLVLTGDGGPRQLTEDHRVTHPGERTRILESGGFIQGPYVGRGTRGLMVTRAFGDRHFRPAGIIAIPEVATHPITPADRWMILGCDGLWDVVAAAEIAPITAGCRRAQAVAATLAQAVEDRRGRDNLTILVVRLPRARPDRRGRTGVSPHDGAGA